MMTLRADSERDMEGLGGRLAAVLEPGCIIYLSGPLGAGKTTLVRGLLRALGHRERVKSPTYTLVESYELAGRRIHHFDLYRVGDPAELDYIGFSDFVQGDAVCLVEWPEKGAGRLPAPDIAAYLDIIDAASRNVRFDARTPEGRRMLDKLTSTTRKH